MSAALLAEKNRGKRARTVWHPSDPVALHRQLEPVYAVGQISPLYPMLKTFDSTLEASAGFGVVIGIFFAITRALDQSTASTSKSAESVPNLILDGIKNLAAQLSTPTRQAIRDSLDITVMQPAINDTLESYRERIVQQVVMAIGPTLTRSRGNATLDNSMTPKEIAQIQNLLQPISDALRISIPATLREGLESTSPLASSLEQATADKLSSLFDESSLTHFFAKNSVTDLAKTTLQGIASMQFTAQIYLLVGVAVTATFFLYHYGGKIYRDIKSAKLDEVGVLAMEHARLTRSQWREIDAAPNHIKDPVRKIEAKVAARLGEVATADNSGGHIARPSIAHAQKIWKIRNEMLLGRPTEKLAFERWFDTDGPKTYMQDVAQDLASFSPELRMEFMRDFVFIAVTSLLPFEGGYNIDLRGLPGTGKDFLCALIKKYHPDRFTEYSVPIERMGEGGPGSLPGCNWSAIDNETPPTTRQVGLGIYLEAAFDSGWTNGILYNKEAPWDSAKMQQVGKLFYDHAETWQSLKAYETEYNKSHHINVFSSNMANFSGEVIDEAGDDGGVASRMNVSYWLTESPLVALESSKNKEVDKVRKFFATPLPSTGQAILEADELVQFDNHLDESWAYLKDQHPRAGIGARVLFAGTLAASIATSLLVKKSFDADELASLGLPILSENAEGRLDDRSVSFLTGMVDRQYDRMIRAHDVRKSAEQAFRADEVALNSDVAATA